MRTRGSKYWAWADPMLHSRCHEEVCSDGNIIDVQVRLSCTGLTKLFIGVYSPSGDALFEDAYYARPDESMSTALAWGIERARSVATKGSSVDELLATSR